MQNALSLHYVPWLMGSITGKCHVNWTCLSRSDIQTLSIGQTVWSTFVYLWNTLNKSPRKSNDNLTINFTHAQCIHHNGCTFRLAVKQFVYNTFRTILSGIGYLTTGHILQKTQSAWRCLTGSSSNTKYANLTCWKKQNCLACLSFIWHCWVGHQWDNCFQSRLKFHNNAAIHCAFVGRAKIEPLDQQRCRFFSLILTFPMQPG